MTNSDLIAPIGLGVVVLVLVVVLVMTTVALRRERRAAAAQLEATRVEAAQLRERVDALAHQVQPRATPQEFVITDMRAEPGRQTDSDLDAEPGPTQRIEGKLFIDLVVRESVVKAASLTHGLRRALAPEARSRIRFAMKQQTKRARKQRRIEIREVRREMAARQQDEEGAA